MSPAARSLSLAALLLALAVTHTAARQQGVLTGVVVETRTDQSNRRAMLVDVQGSTQTFDQVALEFPRGVLADNLTIVPPANGIAWPSGWQARVDGRTVTLAGPAIDPAAGLFRLDLGQAPAPPALNVQISLGGRRLFDRDDVKVTELAPMALSTHLSDVVVLPDIVTPGTNVIVGVRNPERTPLDGAWTFQLQLTPNGPRVTVPVAPAAGQATQLVARVPAESSIVDDIVSAAVKSGFGGGAPAATTTRPDHLTDADWAALTHQEAQIQERLVNEFTRLSQGTASAVADYLQHMDAYRTAFQRITSSSTALQAKLAEWEQIQGTSQKADLALAVAQLAYGGIKGGAALFRWLTRPKTLADATAAGVRAAGAGAGQVDNAAAAAVGAVDNAAPLAGAARPNALGLADQITNAQRGAIRQMASELGVDAGAWIARFANLEDAYVAMVNQAAAAKGYVSLTTPAQRLLERLVVAAANARAGRAGAATAQEIAQLRQWASQPGFWERLGRATSWFEEPGRLVAGGMEMHQPAQQFALAFSRDEIALLRALAESDEAARLATRLGSAADEVPTFIERAAALDTPTSLNPGRAPVIPPTINRLPPVDTPTLINPGRPAPMPPTILSRAGAALDTPTFIDGLPSSGPLLRFAPQGSGLQLLPPGPRGTVRLTESAIQGGASEWSTLLNLRSSGAFTPAIAAPLAANAAALAPFGAAPSDAAAQFAALGGLNGTLSVRFVDRWGDEIVRAEQPLTLLPPMQPALQPRLFDATPLVFPGDVFCVCGLFPGASSSALRLNGQSIPAVTSSEAVTCLQMPPTTPAGSYEVSGDPAAGFDASNVVRVGVLTLSGELDRNKLLRGESTPIRLWIGGTLDAKPIRLRNTTPGIITLTGGDDQVVTTSGGATNEWRGTVTGIRPGPFQIMFSIDGPSCPCAQDADRWASFVGITSGTVPPEAGSPASPAGPGAAIGTQPLGFDFWIDPTNALTVRPAAPLSEAIPEVTDPFINRFAVNRMQQHAAERRGWHPLPADVAGVVDRVLAAGLEAVVTGGQLPQADVQTLQGLAKTDGFWNWLASSQSGGELPVTLRYSTQDIQFLQAVVGAGGDLGRVREALGPIRMAALSALVGEQAASTARAQAFNRALSVADSSLGPQQVVDYESFIRTLWGDNEVFSALRYYGLVSGEQPSLDHFGWMLADYAYGWLTSPVETASRTRATLEAQSAYDEFLTTAGDDLVTLGRAATGALAALDRLNTTLSTARLADSTSVLGGAAARDLQGVLERMQAAFDQATPAWKAAHAGEMAGVRAHIEQKLGDLAAATSYLQDIAGALPAMIQWLESLTRDPQGGVRAGSALFTPELFVRLGSVAMYLETMASAGLLIADDPVGASNVRGPVTPERRPMTLDELRASAR